MRRDIEWKWVRRKERRWRVWEWEWESFVGWDLSMEERRGVFVNWEKSNVPIIFVDWNTPIGNYVLKVKFKLR